MKTISIKIRVLIYVFVFVATCAITFVSKVGVSSYETEDARTMGGANLPIVYMTTDTGLNYNYLHGYTCDVEQKLIHDVITPISSDRTLGINVGQFSSAVTEISYEVRSLDGESLIERSSVKNFKNKNGLIKADLKFKNLLDANKEYMLKINVSTEASKKASYYTRMIIMDDANVALKLDYVNNFSAYTLDKDQLTNVTAKLETDSTGDNTNLGRVNIHSKLSQVGFGELNPKLLTDRYITLNEIDGTIASITVNYMIETVGESDSQAYNVKEYYRINQPDDTVTYVYSFDRWMDQIFDASVALSSTGELYLGICSDKEAEMKASDNGKVTCFVRENHLWTYSIQTNQFVEIFSFDKSDGNDQREAYGEHAIKVLDVENNGNAKFIVYGYMNRGQHEGELGISVFEYDARENVTGEIAFIPRTDPYQSIANDINTLAYVNDENILYLYSNESIYYLNCTTKECMVVSNNILPSSCIMANKGDVLIYQTGNKAYDCNEFYLLHLETGQQHIEKAAGDSKIKVLGFMDGNIVYGEAYSDMIKVDDDGNVKFPMYKLFMMDDEHEVVKEYVPEGMYITDVIFEAKKLSIERAILDENGNLVGTQSDALLSNQKESTGTLKISTRATDIRQKENYLSLVSSGTSGKTTVKYTKYEYVDDSTVNIIEKESNIEKYYAYGYGCMYKVTESLAQAMEAAAQSGGVVIDSKTQTIWSRYKSKEHTISIAQDAIVAGIDTRVAATDLIMKYAGIKGSSKKLYEKGYTTIECLEELVGKVYNLTGSTIDLAAYFIDNGYLIMAKTGPAQYEIVYGYSASNVSTIDLTTGATKSYTLSEFDNNISLYGSVMLTAEY